MAPGLPGPLASGWSQGGGWDVQLSCEEERASQPRKGNPVGELLPSAHSAGPGSLTHRERLFWME